MASRGRTLTVYLAADTKKAQKEVTGFTSFLKSDFVRGLGVAAAATAAWSVALDSVKGALADAQDAANLGNLLGNLGFGAATDEVNDFVDSLTIASGVADTEIRAALSRLLPVTRSVADAQALLAASMDAAQGSGKSLASVVEAMSKAVAGNSTSLLKMFPELKNVSGAATDASIAIAALNESYGGAAAAAASTFTGQIQRVGVALDELKEAFGTGLVEGFVGDIGESSEATENFIQTLKENQPTVESFGNSIGSIGSKALESAGLVINLNQSIATLFGSPQDATIFGFFSAFSRRVRALSADLTGNEAALAEVNAEMAGTPSAASASANAMYSAADAYSAAANAANIAAGSIAKMNAYAAAGTATTKDLYFGGTPTAGYAGDYTTRNVLAARAWAAAQQAAAAAARGVGGSSSSAAGSTNQLSEAQRKAAAALEQAVQKFKAFRGEVYSGITELNKAIDSYKDAWLGAFDDINAKLTGGNDIGAWFEEWRRLGDDIVAADKAITDAIAAGDKAGIEAASERRRLLGGLPTLQDYIAGKTQSNINKASLIGELFPDLIGTAEGRQILDSFVGLAPEAVKAFVTAYGQQNIASLATLLTQQNSETGAVAKLFADSGYYNGVSAAKQTVIALKDQLDADEQKLRRMGEKAGKAIGAGIKAEVAKAIAEAVTVAGSGGYGDPIAAALSLQKTVVTATRRLGV
jgi:hypothetical protein